MMNRYPANGIKLLACAILVTACGGSEKGDEINRENYQQAVSSFYLSIAAAETDEALFAFNKMNEVSRLFPEEPAAWANLGVYAMRQGNYELAAERLSQARERAPQNPDILFLSALLEDNRGNVEESIRFLREAYGQAPENPKTGFMLFKQLERQGDSGSTGEARTLLEEMMERHPGNRALLLEMIRFTAKERDTEAAARYIDELGTFTDSWDTPAKEQFEKVRETASSGDLSALSIELALLENRLNNLAAYRDDKSELELPPNQVAYLITNFLELPKPDATPAEPDSEMVFTPEPLAGFETGEAQLAKSFVLLEDVPPLTATVAGGRLNVDNETDLPFPGPAGERLHHNSVIQIDYDYDFLNDLALAGAEGFRLFKQTEEFSFIDVTAQTGLPATISNGSYHAAWSADLDVDGDLDLLLSRLQGEVEVLRNNGDGTFSSIDQFANVENAVTFLFADFDNDGDPDAVFLNSEGHISFFKNERSGRMIADNSFPFEGTAAGIYYGDLQGDSFFDLVVCSADGSITSYQADHDGTWTAEELFNVTGFKNLRPASARLFVEDVDNNGSPDLLISAEGQTEILLGSGDYRFTNLGTTVPVDLFSVVDIDGDARLDLLGLDENRGPVVFMNNGSKPYNARSVRIRASGPSGDQRINSFGIGGEIEVRSGLLYQKQPITSPIVHLGLGTYGESEMLRIIWPNGSVQAEFAELGIGDTIFNEQILKGSCPWLFTHNGEEHVFVTDLLWRSPLGLRINAQETAGVIQTEDRVRIPGEALVPEDGVYDLRITAELWETHFFDHISLVAVDHPEDTGIYIDERFAFPSPDLNYRVTGLPRPVEKVLDQNGNDVTGKISEIDRVYLHAFEKSKYQGVAKKHSIEVTLGDEAPEEGPLWLLAHGWVRPTDSSINLALSQGRNQFPKGISIDVPDGNGGWKSVYPDLGFPAGKTKTVMINLEGIFPDNSDRRIRLTTSTETYWDAIEWAAGKGNAEVVEREPAVIRQELAYRGYSKWVKEDEFSPELPEYDTITGTTPRWQDLTGYYTRFGDVSELLEKTDDRYIIMNAGDEIQLEFEALPEPEPGFRRTFVMISDGWVKDGDLNTGHSKTVFPLPSHDQSDEDYINLSYDRLQDDPVYRKHKKDWINYHTRYITPELFRSALQFNSDIETSKTLE